MFKKKFAGVAVGAAALLLLSACSSGDNAKDDTASKEGGHITIITSNLANPFWLTEAEVAKAKAEELGYTASYASHEQDPNKQSELIDAAIENKSVAIILDNAGADASIGPVQKATDAGIPVFLVNAEINEEGIAKSQIVSNNAQGAAIGAEKFVEVMDGTGNYVELVGLETDTNSSVRSQGYASVISQYPDMVLLQQETANWNQDEGFAKMETMLQAHPDIKGVISGNDQMALGAIAALEKAGRTDVVVMGFDGAPDAAEAVVDGKLVGTVLQPIADIATQAVEQADSFIKTGKTGAKSEKQSIDCVLITKDNAANLKDFVLTK
ncbi:D-ribose ABC transporter substrate-binding protein [Lysinibacter cavernae]|uniref:Erythritol transport system substrate-binding protein n=1 Tax=Lysinibacter cavernae TaxID=1640652 RepID=A0A7X5R1G5_9MICO|nr:D-ribose ABC transporter substrate-binding protein [Lysinibacter cavernae]NIH53954.1 erythritol transport system substrate-binding protein [Lysinibacter cavernae]